MQLGLTILTDANVEYIPSFLAKEEADQLFQQLLTQTDWQQDQIQLYGKTHNLPRLTSWMADKGVACSYSGIDMRPCAWLPSVSRLRQSIEQFTGATFNGALMNYYRNGQDSMGWHSDDEAELGPEPVIASISLGGVRAFHMRHKQMKGRTSKINLEHGSLLLMKGRTQQFWQHHLPKRRMAEPRINLSFRRIEINN